MKRQIKQTVYRILQEDTYARTDDNYLIMRVVQELEPNLAGTSFVNVMQGLKYKGISFERYYKSKKKIFRRISRAKRKRIRVSKKRKRRRILSRIWESYSKNRLRRNRL